MIVRTSVPYRHGPVELKGCLYHDDALSTPLPGVLLIHEFTGPGAYMIPHAERLAAAGYAAFICDMYGKNIRPESKAEASAQSRIYRGDRELMRARARASLDALSQLPYADSHRLSAIGFSFGGCAALELLRSGAPLTGAVSFYGYLNTPLPCQPETTQGRALILHGTHDKVVPMDEIPVFEQEMRTAGVEYDIIVYDDAGHGFANASHEKNPATGSWYCKKTCEKAWSAALDFLSRN